MKHVLVILSIVAASALPLSTASGQVIFQDDFSSGNLNNWTILNGSWSVNNGEMCGTSDGALISPNTGSLTSYEFTCAARFQAGLAWGIDFRYLDPYNRLRLDFAPGAPNQLNVNIYQNGVLAAHPYAGTCTQYGSYTAQHYCKFVVNGPDFQVYFGNNPDSLDLLCDTTFAPFTSGAIRYQVWGYPPNVWSCFDNVLIESMDNWQLVYDEDFSSDPGWITNNAAHFYWNAGEQNYYADIVNNLNEYGVAPIAEANSSFRLEFDSKVIVNDWATTMCFGLYDDEIAIFPGSQLDTLSTLFFGFTHGDQGRGFDLWSYTPPLNCNAVSNFPGFNLNQWYHVLVEYDAEASIASYQVSQNGIPYYSNSMSITGSYLGLSHLGFSRRWFSYVPGHTVAYVDNVKLYKPPTGPGGQIPPILWSHPYGGNLDDYIYCVQQTQPDSGFITAGAKTVNGLGTQIWVFKTDPGGNMLWEHTWGGSYNDYGYWIEQTNDGGYIVVGSWKYTNTDYDAYLIKLDANGNTQWEHNYGGAGDGDDGTCVQQTSDGGYIFTGGTYSYGIIWDAWLVKVNSIGVQEWMHTYPREGYQAMSFVQQTSDGGYILSGYTTPYYPMPWDAWVIKTNQNGDTLWTNQFGGSGGEYACCVRQVSDGYVATGFTDSYGAGGTDGLIYKLNNNGSLVWHKTYGGSGDDEFRKFQITPDGGYAVIGTNALSTSTGDFWLVRTDAQGDSLWTQIYSGNNAEVGADLDLTSDGGFILAGWTQSYGAGGWDGWLVRLGPAGPPPPPPPALEIALIPLNPPILIPQNGGSFSFNVTIANNSTTVQLCDIWSSIQLPPPGGTVPSLGPIALNLPPNSSMTRLRSQSVPANAPPGSYLYCGYVGDYPWNVTHTDNFPFAKAGAGNWGLGASEWLCTGEPFPGEVGATEALPTKFALHQAFPNPFNPSTVVRFELRAASYVSLQIYDTAGRLVATLVDGWREAGEHRVTFDGSKLPSGVYLFRLQARGFTASGKTVLLK